MTTIAYRDGVLAADTLHSSDGIRISHRPKVERLADGSLLATKGQSGHGRALKDWIEGGRVGPQPQGDGEGSGGVCIRPGGTIEAYEAGVFEVLSGADYWAWGSGQQIALGAMHAGAGAFEAVQAAIAHDVFSGGEITVLTAD